MDVMSDLVLILIAVMACYVFLAHLEHKKKIDLIDRGVWKPEEKKEKPEHRLITGFFFVLLGMVLLIMSYSVKPDLVVVLRISGLLTSVAGVTLMITYVVTKTNVDSKSF